MGWLELLPLLKRLLPLLDRLAPLLESVVAGRFSGRAEAERVSTAAVAEVTRSNDGLQQALNEQRTQASQLLQEVRRLHDSHETTALHLDAREEKLARQNEAFLLQFEIACKQITALQKLVRGVVLPVLAIVLISALAVVVLLILLLRSHTA